MPYICGEMGKIEKEILCPDCLKRGKRKLLGKNMTAEGEIKLWCNACKEEKVIHITK